MDLFILTSRILDRFGGYLSKDFRDSPLDLSGQITGTNYYNVPNTQCPTPRRIRYDRMEALGRRARTVEFNEWN